MHFVRVNSFNPLHWTLVCQCVGTAATHFRATIYLKLRDYTTVIGLKKKQKKLHHH